MINSNTSFGKLNDVIVGRELYLDRRMIDITFKYFYKEALGYEIYDDSKSSIKICNELIEKRNHLLDNLANTLSSLGINVYRPDKIENIKRIETPTFKTYNSSASNVRDLTLIYSNKIIETPTFIRNRVFENMSLYRIFNEFFDNGKGGQWIKAPITRLTEKTIDIDNWRKKRDFSNIPANYEMAIDAALFLRIGKDVIVNVTTYNHFLGYLWIKSLFPETTFHMISVIDNHIDGALICLKPGIFLANPKMNRKIDLPDKFKSWKIIYPKLHDYTYEYNGSKIASSDGMDINVLSIDEKRVLVLKRAINVIKALEQYLFEVIPIELDNGEIFGGGIHCSTLDLNRQDEYIDYT